MINITLTTGDFIQWNPDQYTDYLYDGKCFIILKGLQRVGLYNLDSLRSVEVDQ